MSLEPDGGPWSVYPLEDGDELLDAHNDILLKFQPTLEPRTKCVIAAAPEMLDTLDDVFYTLMETYGDKPQDVPKDIERVFNRIEELLTRIDEESRRL